MRIRTMTLIHHDYGVDERLKAATIVTQVDCLCWLSCGWKVIYSLGCGGKKGKYFVNGVEYLFYVIERRFNK